MDKENALSLDELSRYQRQTQLPEFGLKGQLKLKEAAVLVVGAGGLGCPVLQYLTAAGIGRIGIIDDDIVSLSNLQRQVLYSVDDLGNQKTSSAKEKVNLLNKNVEVVTYNYRLDQSVAINIFKEYDVIVDCSDNFKTRYLVNDACVILNKILVFGSIYKFEGQISVFNFQDGPTYRCLYPEAGELESCAEIGVIGVLPGIVGTLMANEVIKIVAGIGNVLSGKLLVIQALNLSFKTYNIKPDSKNKEIKEIQHFEIDNAGIEPDEFNLIIKDEKTLLVDVRNENEHLMQNIGGVNLPLPNILNNEYDFNELLESQNKDIVVFYCQSGIRSKRAVEKMTTACSAKFFTLNGGLNNLKNERA